MSKLAEACALSFEEWVSSFPETMPKAECSPKHEKWKKKLFNKMRNDRYHVLTTKTIKIMLVAAILCALLMSAFVFPSSREAIVDTFDEFSLFKITRDNNNYVNSDIKVGYIPEGYVLDSCNFEGKNTINRYVNSKGEFFSIIMYSSSVKVEYDTENLSSDVTIIDGIKFVYCEGDLGLNKIIWIKHDYVYQIEAHLNKNELLRIAGSVE
ncbi:MAG: DUF4367 domain-containing protein [Clostridia bacterium]|nr:DUF4367 domain-containing protein [Clostridia bacterium]